MNGLRSLLGSRSIPAAPAAAEPESPQPEQSEYEKKLRREQDHFGGVANIHDLPPIFHYWSNKYIRPIVEAFGFTLPEELYAKYLALTVKAGTKETPIFLSVGAGDGETEIRVAQLLREAGVSNFCIECLDVNPALLERGRELAGKAGLADRLAFVEADFNIWVADKQYSAVIANQSLHHVLDLERLFDQIKKSLRPDGYFVTSDMIGRNGHQRWPEALQQVQQFWHELPKEYRWNRALKRYEDEYMNHDCSVEGFEGVRAQDILPLLVERFDFNLFIAFGNVVNVFVDRSIGYSFDLERERDRQFIDRVHAFDEQAILNGYLTPTQMFAVMTPEPCSEHHYSRGLSPRSCVRDPNKVGFPPTITSSSSLRGGMVGVEHRQQLAAGRGKPPYTWSVAAGTLPPGLVLDASSGLITGQPSSPGTSTFTVRVVASDAKAAEGGFVLTIDQQRETRFVLPHITCGGGWKTSFRLINALPLRPCVKMRFRDGDGNPLPFPLAMTTAGWRHELNADEVTEVMEPYSSLEVETARQEGIESPGWAEIVCSGSVTGYASFDYLASSGVTVDLVPVFPPAFLLAYDNTEKRKIGVALANADSAAPASMVVTIWDEGWIQLDLEQLTIPACGHASFLLADKFPVTGAKRGIIEFRAAAGGKVAGLGLRFHPDGYFFAIPALSRPAPSDADFQ
jgi:SAM-dependent methyltransferase